MDPFGLVGLPTDNDSASQSIWQALRRGDWDEAISLIDDAAGLIPEKIGKALADGINRMRAIDKWRKQMTGWCRKDQAAQLKTLKKTLEEHLVVRKGVDTPETWRIRYQIDFLENLLK